jgi:predicted alpha/beta superfamily hydrolase
LPKRAFYTTIHPSIQKGVFMTFDQFKALTLKEQAVCIMVFRKAHQEKRAALKAEKAALRLEKQQAKALKQEQAIVRAQLRLEKLLAKQVGPVGAKAIKAARKPSKVVVLKGQEAAHAVA